LEVRALQGELLPLFFCCTIWGRVIVYSAHRPSRFRVLARYV
jgi:hypothetical protein